MTYNIAIASVYAILLAGCATHNLPQPNTTKQPAGIFRLFEPMEMNGSDGSVTYATLDITLYFSPDGTFTATYKEKGEVIYTTQWQWECSGDKINTTGPGGGISGFVWSGDDLVGLDDSGMPTKDTFKREKQKAQQAGAGYPPQGVGSPDP